MQQTNKIPNFNCCFSKESDDKAAIDVVPSPHHVKHSFSVDSTVTKTQCVCVDFVYYFYESYVFISNSWNIRIDISCQIDRHLLCQLNNDRKELTFFCQWGNNISMSLFSKAELEGIEKGGFVCDGFLKFLIWIYTMHNFWGGEKGVEGVGKKTVYRIIYEACLKSSCKVLLP